MNKLQKNVVLVLERMIKLVKEDKMYAKIFEEVLEPVLEDIAMDDGFGTERQRDPRGDGRNQETFTISKPG